MRYWLMKSEPGEFSLEDLRRSPEGTAAWDGVRNFQARNLMRDEMRAGDTVLFYHSNARPPAVVGLARVVGGAYPDDTAWDPDSPYYDPRSSPENPRWVMVDIRFERALPAPVPLAELKRLPALQDMLLLQKGQRLSVQPVRAAEFRAIVAHADRLARGQGGGGGRGRAGRS